MRNAFAYLMIFCVVGAFVGLWLIGLPEKPPILRSDHFRDAGKMADEIARLKAEIKHKDAIIERQNEIIARMQQK